MRARLPGRLANSEYLIRHHVIANRSSINSLSNQLSSLSLMVVY